MLKSNFVELNNHLNSQILGQDTLIENLLIALLANGHILVEGPPGLAKTRSIRALADCISSSFSRIQFTPDILPTDITGGDIYRAETNSFEFRTGPLFNNIILADEINRAPAKVQSALLEAMAENQISNGNKTYQLPSLFMVMATQNPLENEGTYPLPEAQLDRFMLHLQIDYPNRQTELEILRLAAKELEKVTQKAFKSTLNEETILKARSEVLKVHLAPELEQYIVDLVIGTRQADALDKSLGKLIECGASPRASIALARCARARAWLLDRDYVVPEDIKACAYPVIRHRIILSFEAKAEQISANEVIKRIIELVAYS